VREERVDWSGCDSISVITEGSEKKGVFGEAQVTGGFGLEYEYCGGDEDIGVHCEQWVAAEAQVADDLDLKMSMAVEMKTLVFIVNKG